MLLLPVLKVLKSIVLTVLIVLISKYPFNYHTINDLYPPRLSGNPWGRKWRGEGIPISIGPSDLLFPGRFSP
jgi:hypothetical protein